MGAYLTLPTFSETKEVQELSLLVGHRRKYLTKM